MSDGQTRERLLPTGICWCGCGGEAALGAFFSRGHDKVAEGALLAAEYDGSVARLLAEHGYGRSRSVTDAAVAGGAWVRCAEEGCTYAGTPNSVGVHRRKVGH
ncbi:hypothetical protein AB6N24_09020 [Cellulomonas sp. 179-A 4D5 NHS]|uniref:hypothetical protein n=1 Tax=Cellulomonas sp. 179-A 4D5 NHS TaxID=3142378 RepID=UPI00399FCDB7